MKKYISFVLFLFTLTSVLAQTTYEKGFFIDNAGNRSEGYIKNVDWKDNPVSFEFSKTAAAENPITKTMKQVQAFDITGVTRYERHLVKIDRASQDVKDLGYNRNPEMKEETLFLKVMLDGKNKLYRYRDNNTLKLYYKKGTEPINALVYKRYLNVSQDIAENNYYKQQLMNDFKCEGGKMPGLKNLNYTTPDLLNFFQAYNACTGVYVKEVDQRENGVLFQITAVAGMNANSYSVDPSRRAPIDFGSSTTPVFGIEFEYIMPFNNKKWSIFLDARYASFSKELTIPATTVFGTQPPFQQATLDFSSFDVSPGFRHYFFLNESSKIFLNLSFAIEVSSDTTLDFERSPALTAEIGTGTFGVGVGYTFKDLRIEGRFNGNKNHFEKAFGRGSSKYSSFMFTLGYSFVKF